MSTVFSKIAAGEIPSYKCAESDKFYAFLDIDPVTKGHTWLYLAGRLTIFSTWMMMSWPSLKCLPSG